MDVGTELHRLENSIRDLIDDVLSRNLGSDWVSKLKVSSDRIERWKERKETEVKRLKGKALDTRLLYYSDFYDLRSILQKHWCEEFKNSLGEQKTVLVYLEEVEKIRDPHAHRRELFEYQKHLVLGISGELRSRIVRNSGKGQNPDDYFPVIESVVDTAGYQYSRTGGSSGREPKVRVGDKVEITITASDPFGEELLYRFYQPGDKRKEWMSSNQIVIEFTEEDIGRFDMNAQIKSNRDYHLWTDHDESHRLLYLVLPKEK